MNEKPTQLEELPNEIFLYYMFPLFTWENLYQTFHGLNQRFNKILRSLRHLNFTVNRTNEHHPALVIFTPSIARLIVYLGNFDLTPFSSLRSLDLQYPSLQQRNSIRPKNFPLLEFLKLSYPLEDSILLNLIFSNAFEHLKHCRFDRILTDHSWNGSPKLRSLSVSVHHSYGTICILRACPNIHRLNIIVYDTPQKNVPLVRHSISCMNLSLRRLFIRSSFEILTGILSCMPNLKWITFEDINIHLNERNSEFNFKLLTDVLRKLPQLSYLHFSLKSFIWDGHTSLQSLHPLFQRVTSDGTSILSISGCTTKNE